MFGQAQGRLNVPVPAVDASAVDDLLPISPELVLVCPELRARAIALLDAEVPRWVVSRPGPDNADPGIADGQGSTFAIRATVEGSDPERRTATSVVLIAILYFVVRLGDLALRIAMVAAIVVVVVVGIWLFLHALA
jgi:hypothetical protein